MATEDPAQRASPRCWSFVPLRWLAKGVARLPQRVLLGSGVFLTWLLWPLLGKRRRYAKVNIDLCFPELDDRARRRLLHANLRATVTGLLELIRAWFAPSWALRGLTEVEGLEHLRAARASGRGVLLLCGHFPHLELCTRLLAEASGEPIGGVSRNYNHPCIDRLISEARQRVFSPNIGKKDVRGLLRVLSRGGIVVYAADQNFTYQSAFVPFFGIQASTLTTTPDLARRTGAVVLPFWVRRDVDGRYRLRIEPQWEGWPSGDPVADAARGMSELEAVVRRQPEQYLWVHRRFKTRPPGEPDLYRRNQQQGPR